MQMGGKVVFAIALSAFSVALSARAEDGHAEDEALEVLVQGSRAPSLGAPKDRNLAGSVVKRERLEAPGLQAADVLRTQPGVIVTESGGFGAPSTAAIRGATAQQTPVYLAGVRLNDDIAGTADVSLVPLWLLDRVEVYRGNAPIEADRLGIGGAIFFEPRRPSRTMGGAGLLLGSFGAKGIWAYQGIGNNRASAIVGVRLDGAKNDYPFVNDKGTLFDTSDDTIARRVNADTRLVDLWGVGRIHLNERGAMLDVVVNGGFREQGVPKLALVPSERARSEEERALFSIGSSIPFGQGGRHRFEARTTSLLAGSAYRDPLHELSMGTTEVSVSGQRIEQSVGVTLAVTDHWLVRPLVNVAHERIHRSPDDIPLDRSRRVFARASLSSMLRLSSLVSLHALASGECHITTTANDDCDVFEPTGRIGAKVGTENLAVLANLSRYARVPTLGETYGVSGVVRGNANLLPENGVGVDLGLRAKEEYGNASAFADAFVFGRAATDLVAYKRTAQGYVVPYNVGRARVLGAEVLVGASFTSYLFTEVSATLLDPRDTSEGRTTANDILPYRSRLIVVPRVRSETQRLGRIVNKIGAEIRYVYQSNRYADPAGLALIDEQGSCDFEAEAWGADRVAMRLRIANMLNQRRTDVVGYPLPGRSAFVGLEATW